MITPIRLGNIYNNKHYGSSFGGTTWDIRGLSPTLETAQGGNRQPLIIEKGGYEMAEEKQVYRIRKLTPRECFRLMGVKDEDYDKLTVSDTQKYKQAGNSIVVDVLEDIFDNMFVKECKSGRLF